MIVFVHLYSDYSGSPRVLKNIISELSLENMDLLLYLGKGCEGILNELTVPKGYFFYNKFRSKYFTFLSYVFSQIILFFTLIFDRRIKKKDIFYINTILPFGAALYCKIFGNRIIYHIHEVAVKPRILDMFLKYIVRFSADHIIYVSFYQKNVLKIQNVESTVIYNGLSREFNSRAVNSVYQHKYNNQFNILMLSSLKDYKGIPELINLAKKTVNNQQICFDLVVNADNEEINEYFNSISLPKNINIHSRVSDTIPFYKRASLVLNLSRVDLWVETFALTVLESMAFGIPVIAPPIGGPAELIKDGQEGFLIDSRHTDRLFDIVCQLYNDESICMSLSCNARNRAFNYRFDNSIKKIKDVIYEK